MLTWERKARLEHRDLSRIARELDEAAHRIEEIRQWYPQGQSIHTRVVNASMQVKVAAGALKFLTGDKNVSR